MPTILLLLLAALSIATWAHFAYWRRRLAIRDDADQQLVVPAGGGWRIALARRRPRAAVRPPPILLCHGIATNRRSLDFPVAGHSLALYLAERGFDCFALDLRGHGTSQPGAAARRRWTLDDHLTEDIPAALAAIREETGSPTVLWVGHSLGALLGLAACALHPEQIEGVVAIAPPGQFGAKGALRQLVRLGSLGIGGMLRPFAKLWAPFGPIWHPRLAELAIRRSNVEPEVYRLFLAHAAESINPGVLAHLARCIEGDRFRSFDQAVDYGAALGRCRRPALFIAGERDGLSPPKAVQETCVRWGGPKRYLSAGAAYGHTDLLVGRRSAVDVYPLVAAWLEERAPVAPGRAVSR